MTELSLKLNDSAEEGEAVSPDPVSLLTAERIADPVRDLTVASEATGSADPVFTPPPPPPKPKKKRGGKRAGAGRPKKTEAKKSPFNTATTETPTPPDEIAIGGFADMGHVAAVATAALDGVIVGVARVRHGEKADSLHASKKALADIQAAMVVYLEHTAIRITPAQALLVAIAAAYGPPVLALEVQHRQNKKLKAVKV
jgi:hypothetical protein